MHTQESPQAQPEATKKCPYCAEWVKAVAIRCRYCQSDLLTVNEKLARINRVAEEKGPEITKTIRMIAFAVIILVTIVKLLFIASEFDTAP